MLDIFKTLFKENNDAEPQLAIELAAAALMFEVMWADHDVEAAELKVMRQYLQSAFDCGRRTPGRHSSRNKRAT